MIRKLLVVAVIGAAAVAAPLVAHASNVATAPALVPSSQPWFYANDVASTVTVDGPSRIVLTSEAYRHPVTVQAMVDTTEAATVEIRDRCKPSRLKMTWRVVVNGVVRASAVLPCS